MSIVENKNLNFLRSELAMKTTKINFFLTIQANNSFAARNEKSVRTHVEWQYLSKYHPKKDFKDSEDYQLIFTHQDEADLKAQLFELLDEIIDYADKFNCFIECDAIEQGTERSLFH